MRGLRLLVAAMVAASLGSPGGAAPSVVPGPTRHPMRVMSINQCTDQIVLALLPPSRIASVSFLARDPHGSLMADAARHVADNHGTAEEVMRQHPDLVIAGRSTTPAVRAFLKRLGWPLLEVDEADSFDAIRTITRQIADAVDARARGEALIADMDRKLADLALDRGPAIRVAAWDGGGFSAGKGSLYDLILQTAGAVNVANLPPASGYGRPDVEVLLATAPQLLLQGGYEGGSLRENVARHPLVRRYWGPSRTLVVPSGYYACGTPMVADAALLLRRQLRQKLATVQTPLTFARSAP